MSFEAQKASSTPKKSQKEPTQITCLPIYKPILYQLLQSEPPGNDAPTTAVCLQGIVYQLLQSKPPGMLHQLLKSKSPGMLW